MTTFNELVQKPSLGARVVLVKVDLSMFGEDDLFWVQGDQGADATKSVDFDGQTYVPFPFKMDGFRVSGSGTLPRPSLIVSDVEGMLTPFVEQHDDLLGARVTRIRTFDRFLDDGLDPDPNAHYPIDLFEVSRKVHHEPGVSIQWELRALTDVIGALLPARQIVRDFCDHTYRRWVSGTTFDYTGATCPYNGTTYLDENDEVTTAEFDQCSKRFTGGCKGRFGSAPLPFRGYPAIARIRVRS